MFFEYLGIEDIEELLAFTDEEISTTSFLADGSMTVLLITHAKKVIHLRTWIQYLHQQFSPAHMLFQDYMDLKAADLRDFCVRTGPSLGLIGGSKPSPPAKQQIHSTSVASAAPVPSPTNSVSSFYKSIKKDKMAYNKLTKPEYMDTWHRTFVATCKTHDCTDILDPSFAPNPLDMDEVKLFEAKQEFMFSVFDHCLQTDITKDFVRKYEDTGDAQAIYKELEDYRKTSTAADIKCQEQMEYFTTAKFDERWSQGAVAFILHWNNQVRLYNKMKSSSPLDDAFKLSCLQRAVRGVKDLRLVSVTAQTIATDKGSCVHFGMYYQLLMSAATIYDVEQGEKQNSRRRRNINFTDISDDLEEEDHDDDVSFTGPAEGYLDLSPQQFLQLNQHKMKKPSGKPGNSSGKSPPSNPGFDPRQVARVPSDLWRKLPPEIQAMLQEHNKQVKGITGPPSQYSAKYHNLWSTQEEPDPDLGTYDLDEYPHAGDDGEPSPDSKPSYSILEHVSGQNQLSYGDIRKVLAANKTKTTPGKGKSKSVSLPPPEESTPDSFTINGKTYVAKMHKVTYHIDKHAHATTCSLMDRGANGGLAGADVRVLDRSIRTVDVTGIDNHQVTDLPIVTCAGKVLSDQGPLILIMHQYAYYGQGKTIHSCCQLEQYKIDVCDKSRKIKGGKQRLITLEGQMVPFQIRGGLPYMEMSVPTDSDMANFPHVFLTADSDWDPSILDNEFQLDGEPHETEEFYDPEPYTDNSFTEDGLLINQLSFLKTLWDTPPHLDDTDDSSSDSTLEEEELFFFDTDDPDPFSINIQEQTPATPAMATGGVDSKRSPWDFEKLRPRFGWVPLSVIKYTLEKSTQYYRELYNRIPMRDHWKTRFPAANVRRRHEPVATDWVYSDTPAIDSGYMGAQIFIGTETLVADAYGAKTDGQFVQHLEDQIRARGAMDKLISDQGQSQISKIALDLLRAFIIGQWTSAPDHQN